MPTIAAVSTPPGRGGIGIIRLSGPGAKTLLSRIFLPHSPDFVNFRPWTLHRGAILDSQEIPLDDVLAVYMPAPNTYTGEDVAEIQSHGSPLIVNAILESLLRLGARLAGPGEFTKRAYLNGRIDLSQAEAVGEIISAASMEAARDGFRRLEGRLAQAVQTLIDRVDELRALAKVQLDFPDDEVENIPLETFIGKIREILEILDRLLINAQRAKMMSQGARVVLAGPANAGKSSLFNALCGRNRALVSELPGTTRDYIDIDFYLDDLPLTLVDTAGIRMQSADHIEQLGMERTYSEICEADLVCVVIDGVQADGAENMEELREIFSRCDKGGLLVWNKIDKNPMPAKLPGFFPQWPICQVSALTGQNIDGLGSQIRSLLLAGTISCVGEDFPPPNVRQADIFRESSAELKALLDDLLAGAPWDCCFIHLDAAFELLSQIVALAPEDEILDRIFSNFCIGK